MKNKLLFLGTTLISFIGIIAQLIFLSLNIVSIPNISVGEVYMVVLLLLIIVIIVEIVSVYTIDDSTYHTIVLASSLFLLYLFSTDTKLFFSSININLSDNILGLFSEFAFIILSFCCCWYMLYLYKLKLNKNMLIFLHILIFSLFILYAITLFFDYGYIMHLIISIIFITIFFVILKKVTEKQKIYFTTYLTIIVFYFSLGTQNSNVFAYCNILPVVIGIPLFFATLTFMMFIIVYMHFSIHSDSKAIKSNEYKQQAEIFETKALTEQIKPHFIFNSLETIRELYHENIELGDEALTLMAKYMRSSINSFDNEFVPFEEELNNIFNYTELKNINNQNKIEVIFNIDFTDFYVPPFSIQPFVENALKYSGVEEKENGNIIISSYKEDNNAVIIINDNGKGFNMENISSSSHGIKNACERFNLAFGIIPEIKSEINKGTNIKIVINLDKQEKRQK